MTGRRSNQSLNNLKRLYAHRRRLAEAKVEEQKAEVRKSQLELREREQKVAKLDAEIQENIDFLNAAGEEVSAEVLHAANRHRYWTDYDKQKEVYYVDMTKQELADHVSELQRRRISLTKLEAKNDVVGTMMKQNHSEIDRRLEADLEDEFDAIYAARKRNHG